LPIKNPFTSITKKIFTGVEDPFEEELRTLTGPKRIFQARTEFLTLGEPVIKFVNSIENTDEFPEEFPFVYDSFTENISNFGIKFNQNQLLTEAAVLKKYIKEEFKDEREEDTVVTDAVMTVFWSNLLIAYFDHVVESNIWRIHECCNSEEKKEIRRPDELIKKLIKDLSIAYAFRNLYTISSESGIPSGNPFDYQWVARMYLRKKMEATNSNAMDYIGDTRWYDGLEKLFGMYFKDNDKKSMSKLFTEVGIDNVKSMPVYLIVENGMPAFSTTIKSSPRTLEEVLREANPINRKFFREVINMVEFSFDLSVNLDYDVGIAVERGDGETLFELYPQTYTHSLVTPYNDLICIPEKILEALRNNAKEQLIDTLLKKGFEMDKIGRMVLILDGKIGWKRWNEILASLKEIANVKVED